MSFLLGGCSLGGGGEWEGRRERFWFVAWWSGGDGGKGAMKLLDEVFFRFEFLSQPQVLDTSRFLLF